MIYYILLALELIAFETKLLTITHIECINYNKLFMYCSHKNVHVINHIDYTVSKNCTVNSTNSKQNFTLCFI